MKHFISFLVLMSFSLLSIAQGTVGKTIVEFNGQKYPCHVIEYELSPDLTEETIKANLKTKGFKPKDTKGFLVYRNIRLNELDAFEPKDLLIKVERKSRSEKNKSIVYVISAKPGEIPEDRVKNADKNTAANVELAPGASELLTGFQPDIDMAAFNEEMNEQEDVVKKAEKKFKDLQDDQSKLEKKLKDLQDDLEVNRKEQEKQNEEVNKERRLLEEKRAKKPGGN